MKKLKAIVISSIFATAASFASAKVYPVLDVIDACERAYSSDIQIATCIANVCNYYGCEYV
ncbi:hypothetical protein [Pleionea sediminis]|uniref:hypothetical protein n=1 Tax=Pleionea sediminis TaxID=2569479 RepID=UPI001184AA00|nr:hypothetical protein [Pleionea sediminis]